jgi:flagellar basal-body rod modification protein FlgD
MTVTSSTSASATAQTTSDTSNRVAQKTLGQDDFLKLITVQLANQDPMSPMEDTAFIAQMSSFTALENSKQLLTQFTELKTSSDLNLAQSLIGKEVTVLDPETEETVTGTVTGVDQSSGTPSILLNGTAYELSTIQKVNTPTNAAA